MALIETWRHHARFLQAGDKIRLLRALPYGAHGDIEAGAVLTIADNSLNELGSALFCTGAGPDDEIVIAGPESFGPDSAWDSDCNTFELVSRSVELTGAEWRTLAILLGFHCGDDDETREHYNADSFESVLRKFHA